MHLADRRGREGTLVEVREHALQRRPELRAQQLLQALEGQRRNAIAQGRQLAVQLLLLVGVEAVELDTIESIWPTFMAAPRMRPS